MGAIAGGGGRGKRMGDSQKGGSQRGIHRGGITEEGFRKWEGHRGGVTEGGEGENFTPLSPMYSAILKDNICRQKRESLEEKNNILNAIIFLVALGLI